MDAVMIEIPDAVSDGSWEPPVISHRQCSKPQHTDRSSWADVFFAQYTVCILLLTAVLVLRLEASQTYAQIITAFAADITAPDEAWVHALIERARTLWS